MISIDYVDAPMRCCGLGMGAGITDGVHTGKIRKIPLWNGKVVEEPEVRICKKEDVKERLQALKERAQDDNRNCLLISISSDQVRTNNAMEAALEENFKVIHEFYNPNSGNQMYIMAYTNYANYEEYSLATGEEDEDY